MKCTTVHHCLTDKTQSVEMHNFSEVSTQEGKKNEKVVQKCCIIFSFKIFSKYGCKSTPLKKQKVSKRNMYLHSDYVSLVLRSARFPCVLILQNSLGAIVHILWHLCCHF